MKRRIEVVHTAVELNGEMTYGTPKTHQRRSVPVPRSLVDALAEHVTHKLPDDLVFTTPRGDGTRSNHNFRSRVFAPAAAFIGNARADAARPAAHRGRPGRAGPAPT